MAPACLSEMCDRHLSLDMAELDISQGVICIAFVDVAVVVAAAAAQDDDDHSKCVCLSPPKDVKLFLPPVHTPRFAPQRQPERHGHCSVTLNADRINTLSHNMRAKVIENVAF